jgi:hypothetical protein
MSHSRLEIFFSVAVGDSSIKGEEFDQWKPIFAHESRVVRYLSIMSAALYPSFQTMASLKTSIQNTLKLDVPPDALANVVAPLVSTVNQWSTQIPLLLDNSGSATNVNLIFAIRHDLFVAPRYTQNVFGLPLSDLPAPFQEFVAFIHKLIEAQKSDKPVPKVRLIFHLVQLFLISLVFL